MKLYLFPAGRANSVLSLKNYLGIDCEVQRLDFTRGDRLNPAYAVLNPNKKMPTLEDDGFVLWESNAILFYLASKRPEKRSGRCLALVVVGKRALGCLVGMVSFEKASKVVMGLGPADPAFVKRGEHNLRALPPFLTAASPARAGLWVNASRSRTFPWGA